MKTTKMGDGRTITWYDMGPNELETVLDDLTREPMGNEEDSRDYTICQTTDGKITVRRGFHPDETLQPSDPNPDKSSRKKKHKEISINRTGPIRPNQELLTEFGSDPPASDQAPELKDRVERNEDNPVNRKCENLGEKLDEHEGYLDNQDLGKPVCENDIKEQDTYQSTLPFPHPIIQESVTTDTSIDGQCVCQTCPACHCPILRPDISQSQIPSGKRVNHPPMKEFSVPLTEINAPPKEGDLCDLVKVNGEHPSPEQRCPAMLATSHLVELKDKQLPRGQLSFVAFDSVLITGIDGEFPLGLKGHAYVRLYGSETEWDKTRRPPPPDCPPIAQTARSYYHATGEFLSRLQMMRAPEGPGWLRDLYPSKRVYRKPLICGSSVNIHNERDEDLALEEAVDGLRALKNEVRFGDLGTPVRDESGEFDSLRDEILAQTDDDLPDIVRKPPLPIKHDRYLRKIDGDDFPDLMKKLNDPSAREPSPEPIVRTYPNHSRWYPEEITIRDANPFRAGRFDAKATPALPTVTVKDEFEDMPGLETPPDLSHSSHLEPYEVISMSESISDDDKASNDGKVATSKLENMVEDDKDVVIVESPEPVVKETKESLTHIATNLDFVVPEMEGMDTEEVQAIILAMGRLGLLQVVNDLAEAKERGLVLEPVINFLWGGSWM